MKKYVFLFCFISNALFAYTLTLINDSPFELTAIVQAATGQHLGQELLQPGEKNKWSTDIENTNVEEIYDSNVSLTPFTVTWKCSYKGYYSISNDVSPGSILRASQGSGSKASTPKPKKEEKSTPPECPVCPECPKETSSK